MDKPLVLYGAGGNLTKAYKKFAEEGRLPVCICDSNASKIDTTICIDGKFPPLKILQLDNIGKLYQNAEFFVTPKPPARFEIMQNLIDSGIPKEKIINYEPFIKGLHCEYLKNELIYTGETLDICCADSAYDVKIPQVRIAEGMNYEDMVTAIHSMRKKTLYDLSSNKGCCINCPKLEEGYYPVTNSLKKFTFAEIFHCQFRCIYCNARLLPTSQLPYKQRKDTTKKALEFAKYLKSVQIINKDTIIVFVNGEISINPLLHEITKVFMDYPCLFLTNAEVYSNEIAKILDKGRSYINVSLDSGTAETFEKIKGKSCFDKVCENIKRYSMHGKVSLKYILLEDINDNEEDISKFLIFAKDINASVSLSRDYSNDHTKAYVKNQKTLAAIDYFKNTCSQEKIHFHFDSYFN
ncbi:MAG: radical SAM protein [Defluviitaleaceae bacterium]|nr:radical SAM protein [Defluviitaleaceae bacterium]